MAANLDNPDDLKLIVEALQGIWTMMFFLVVGKVLKTMFGK